MGVIESGIGSQAQAEAERWVTKALATLRVGQVVFLLPVVIGADDHRQPWQTVGLFVFWVAWSAAFFGMGIVRGVTRLWVLVEVLITAVLMVVVTAGIPGGFTDWQNWTFPPAVGAAVVAVVYLAWRPAATLTLIVLGAYVFSVWLESRILHNGIFVKASGSGGMTIVVFAAVSFVSVRTLRRLACQVDVATATSTEALRTEAEAAARFDERTRQYKKLHDTVLHTLSMVARGGLNHRTVEVQLLCNRDANYLRSLIAPNDEDAFNGLATSLEEMFHSESPLGLDIHVRTHRLPLNLPDHVADAIMHASREALNNVSKYAGTNEAWVTAVGLPGGSVRVTVIDRGRGFDPNVIPSGVGLIRSIRHRMEEVGGSATINSGIGQGTVVELVWSPRLDMGGHPVHGGVHFSAIQDAQRRLEKWVLPSLALNRAANFFTSLMPVVFASGTFRAPEVVIGSFVLWSIWSVVLLAFGLRGPCATAWVHIEVFVVTVLQVVVTVAVPGGYTNWSNWTLGAAISGAMVAVLFQSPYRATLMSLVIVAGYIASATFELLTLQTEIRLTMIASTGLMIMIFAIVAASVVEFLRNLARQVDTISMISVESAQREAVLSARFTERAQQYKMLHGTVLRTLSKIADGSLDHGAAEVQEICGRDADYLRVLITGSDEEIFGGLATALGDLTRNRSALGITVHSQLHRLPVGVPQKIVDAIINASREALNNVSKHAGTEEAWLTAVGFQGKSVKVTVVDQGSGFDPSSNVPGIGFIREIRHGMEAVGGRAVIDSAVGQGTIVELTWNP